MAISVNGLSLYPAEAIPTPIHPVSTKKSSPVRDLAQQIAPPPAQEFTPRLLPVGLLVNGRTKLESISVLGQEDGEKAIRFEDWLLPFDELARALGWRIKELDGQMEISTSNQKFLLPTNKIVEDRRLGRAIAIKDLAAIPGYVLKFDIYQYAIAITRAEGSNGQLGTAKEQPIVLEGLPTLFPGSLGFNIVQQRITATGTTSDGGSNVTQGEFQAAGNVGDAGWYLRINQATFADINTWNISDLSVLRQRRENDLLFGSQIPFWLLNESGSTGTYWGATTVFRQGFDPPVQLASGDYSLPERLQARRTTRAISGRATPGTIVQLVRKDRSQLLQELLVDSSGIYRFNNIAVSGNLDDTFTGRDYQVLLYPRGLLTDPPVIQDVKFSSFSGQIPSGAQAWVFSAGANRVTNGNFGNFDRLQGGILYRRGLNDTLTVGAGVVYDQELRGVGEIFWQPINPLEISLSATTDSKQWSHLGRLTYNPSDDFSLSATSDRLSTNANSFWRLGQSFAALGSYDSVRGPAIGGQYFTSSNNSSTFVQADVDLQGRVRTSANQRIDNIQATFRSNEASSSTQLIYRVDDSNEFALGYQSSETSALWRYRSPELTDDGRSLWQTELGYAVGNGGSGILANAGFNFLPGVQLRASYRGGVSAGNQDSYSLELTTTLLTSGGIRGTTSAIEEFHTLGKVVVQPFLDRNQNGRQDPGEEGYWDPQLILVNQQPITQFRPRVYDNRGDFNLPSGSYRIDIDPAGYPINFSSRSDAIRVEVVPGGVTTIALPLIPTYLVTGFAKNTSGEELAGGRVEATNIKTRVKTVSITNDSGFFTLENLEQGEYQITVSGYSTKPDQIKIGPNSPPSQQINLTVTIPESKPKEISMKVDAAPRPHVAVVINDW
jgi:hypothetical protein